MQSFKTAVICICTLLIFLGGFGLLLPKGKMQSSAKYVLALVITLAICTSVIKLDGINIDFNNMGVNTDIYTDTGALEYQVCYLAGAILDDEKIEYSKITASVDICEDTGISINRIDIYTSAETLAVEQLIKEHFDVLEVRVINE